MIFQVLWLAWTCPTWIGRYIPPAVKPMLCQPEINTDQFDNMSDALDKVRDLGPLSGAVLQGCHGTKCNTIRIDWAPETR